MPESDFYAGGRRRDAIYSSDDDDDRYKRTTVRRYKVGHGQVERVEEVDRTRVEDIVRGPRDRRRGRRSSNDLLEVDRRIYAPERPRSALEISEHTRRYYDDDGRRIVYESTKDIDRDDCDDQIIVESYSKDRRGDGHGGEVERWHKETEYYEPTPAPLAPIVIRQRPVEQRIILQDAPAPSPVIIPRQSQGVLVTRERERPRKKESHEEDDYYYERRERREVGPLRGDREDLVVAQLGRHDRSSSRHHHHHHHHHRRDYASDGDVSADDEYYVTKKTVIRRETTPPASEHRRHLAEGALAGAGIGALLSSRRNQDGELPEHRGRKVIAGAALGALGTEVLKRAHSTYNDRFGEDRERSASRERERSRSPSHHSTLKTGLGIAAAALAVAGAAKYLQSSRVDREERNRGRSLHRYSGDEDEEYHSRSQSRTSRKARSRASSVAKVAAGTAAVAGLVHHIRSKSRGQSGKSRSHSRLRTGAEVVAAGLAGAAAKKLYDKHRDKKEQKEHERDRELADEEYEEERRSRQLESRPRSRSHSRSQSRSGTRAGARRSPHNPDAGYNPPSGADPELGLVEYGERPLYSDDPPYPESRTNSGYSSAAEDADFDGRHRRKRSREHRSRGPANVYDNADDSSYADIDDGGECEKLKKEKDTRSRSRSRLRKLAAAGAGAAAAAAAAIGIKKYEDGKKADKQNNYSISNGKLGGLDNYDATGRDGVRDGRERSERNERSERSREKGREYRERRDGANDGYIPDSRPASPPHASGGAFYPLPRQEAPLAPPGGLMQHSNAAATNLAGVANDTYNPLDSSGYPPPPPGPPGPPDRTIPTAPSSSVAVPGEPSLPANSAPGPTVGQDRASPDSPPFHNTDNVSHTVSISQNAASSPPDKLRLHTEDVNTEGYPAVDDTSGVDNSEKAVSFIPLSPQSSRTLRRHHAQLQDHNQSQRDAKEDQSAALSESGRVSTTSDDTDGDAIEILPDRFDPHGHLLSEGGHAQSGHAWNSLHGDFEYKNNHHNDRLNDRGQWGVAGTDANAVNHIAQNIGEIIDSLGGRRQSDFLGTVGQVLKGLNKVNALLEDKPDSKDGGYSSLPGGDDDKKRKRPYSDSGNVPYQKVDSRGQSHHRDRRAASIDSRDSYYEREDSDRGSRKRRRSWGG